jgi:quercetin 2,3-dioxygenase
MDILTFAEMAQGGFAGLREKRFVMDARVFAQHKELGTVNGIGNFVYLADANFTPKGETGMHSHREIDVISVMVSGNISHAGSLEHGGELTAGMVQIQRAGAEGFSHNEINPDDTENHMIQLWVTPDEPGEQAGYKAYKPTDGERLHVYGGSKDQNERFYSKTQIEVVNAQTGQIVEQAGAVMAYLSKGAGSINGEKLSARTLVQSDDLSFEASAPSQLILIYANT